MFGHVFTSRGWGRWRPLEEGAGRAWDDVAAPPRWAELLEFRSGSSLPVGEFTFNPGGGIVGFKSQDYATPAATYASSG